MKYTMRFSFELNLLLKGAMTRVKYANTSLNINAACESIAYDMAWVKAYEEAHRQLRIELDVNNVPASIAKIDVTSVKPCVGN